MVGLSTIVLHARQMRTRPILETLSAYAFELEVHSCLDVFSFAVLSKVSVIADVTLSSTRCVIYTKFNNQIRYERKVAAALMSVLI